MRAQPRHADRARQEQPVPRPRRRGKPRSVPPHARRRISERRARAARQDRHGVAATSICAIRCSTASCTRRIRAPARPGRSIRATISRTASPTPSRASRIRSARSNSRITGRSTTGSSSNLPVPSRPHQYEFARLNLTYTVLSKRVLTRAGARRPCRQAGTIRACRRLPACAGAACRRRRSAISSSASASPRPTAWSMSACSNFRCAKRSTRPRCGAWRCCGR